MINKTFSLLIAVAALSFGQEKSPAPSQETISTTVELGGEARLVNGEKSFGFQRDRDVPRGAFIRQLDFRHFTEGNPLRFEFRSIDLLQRDALFNATLESVHKYKLSFDWQGFARFWSNQNPSLLNEVSRGVFVAPEALRGGLQNASDSDLARLAANAVSVAPKVSIRSLRERNFITYTYQLRENLAMRLQYMNERRSGNRLWSQGTYTRIGTPSGDTFETPGQEMFEPTAYRTNEIGAELNYTRKNLLLGVEYRGSIFTNNQTSLTWQNPFRLTSEQASQPAGALNRGRFAETQDALPPNNQAHTVTFNAMLLLPRSTRASALFSWSRWTQNDAFLPYTINTAITAPNLPAGTPATSLKALPRPSLDGRINVLTQDYALVSRPWRALQLGVHYNDYDLSNETHEMLSPGYSAFGDSFWRTSISSQPGITNPVQSEPKSFRRQRANVEAAIRPGMDLTWKSGYQLERYHRENRNVELMREHGLMTSLAYTPKSPVFAQAGFRYFDRTPDHYDPGGYEPAFLRMWDQAQRVRKQADAVVSVNVTPTTSLSTSWFYLADTYDKANFGLHQMKTNSVNADLSWNAGENFGMTAGWGYDRTGYDYLMATKTAQPYNFRNNWTRDTRDGVHYAQAGFTGSFAGRKGEYQLSYAVSLARMSINTVNPNDIVPTDTLNAKAYPFPDVKNQFHEFRLNTSYAVHPKVRLGIYYLLEPYRLNDFARDVVSPYSPASLAPEIDARRFQFYDVGMSNYTGNMVAVYLRYSFN